MGTQAVRRIGPHEASAASERELEAFRAMSALAGRTVESELRGPSMEPTIPGGSRIRISHAGPDGPTRGDVVAFLGGSVVMVHRVVYEGRRGTARGFVVTQGDGNWLCDPPVERTAVAGVVRHFLAEGEWREVGTAPGAGARALVSAPALALVTCVLELSPRWAARLARGMSIARMEVRAALGRLRRGPPRVRD